MKGRKTGGRTKGTPNKRPRSALVRAAVRVQTKDRELEQRAATRAARAAAGLCTGCGARPPIAGRRLCAECAEQARRYTADWLARNLEDWRRWNLAYRWRRAMRRAAAIGLNLEIASALFFWRRYLVTGKTESPWVAAPRAGPRRRAACRQLLAAAGAGGKLPRMTITREDREPNPEQAPTVMTTENRRVAIGGTNLELDPPVARRLGEDIVNAASRVEQDQPREGENGSRRERQG